MKIIQDWPPKVYHPLKWGAKRFKHRSWLNLRQKTLDRDLYVCQMCKKEFGYFELTIHHIKPRRLGGKDILSNLITLCNKCHDIAEAENLNKKDILNFQEYKKNKILIKQDGLRWQQWVYGGYKKPEICLSGKNKKITL